MQAILFLLGLFAIGCVTGQLDEAERSAPD